MAIRLAQTEELEELFEQSPWLSIVFAVSFILLLLSLIVFFLLLQATAGLNAEIKALDKGLAETGTAEQKAVERRLKDVRDKISDLAGFLPQHRRATLLLAELEKSAHGEVWFASAKVDVAAGVLALEGRAKNLTALSQQHNLFLQNPSFLEAELQDISLAEAGVIHFGLALKFAPEILQRK